METILLSVHILIAVALVGTVLLQRSEGGGLGIGGSGGAGGGFMTARGTANFLTRLTAMLAVCFFATSIGLAILAGTGTKPNSIIDDVISEQTNSPTNTQTDNQEALDADDIDIPIGQ